MLALGRRPAVVLAVLLTASSMAMSGCAGARPDPLSEEPGVRVHVSLVSGESFRATLVAIEEGALVLERSRVRSERLSVTDRDGTQVVYVDGSPVGTVVAVRDVDVLVRERVAFFRIEDVRVVSRAYFGWGTAIAAVMAFFLVKILEEV
jgi:hypothetical protein